MNKIDKLKEELEKLKAHTEHLKAMQQHQGMTRNQIAQQQKQLYQQALQAQMTTPSSGSLPSSKEYRDMLEARKAEEDKRAEEMKLKLVDKPPTKKYKISEDEMKIQISLGTVDNDMLDNFMREREVKKMWVKGIGLRWCRVVKPTKPSRGEERVFSAPTWFWEYIMFTWGNINEESKNRLANDLSDNPDVPGEMIVIFKDEQN